MGVTCASCSCPTHTLGSTCPGARASFAVEEATISFRISSERSNLRGPVRSMRLSMAEICSIEAAYQPVLLVPGNHERSRMPFPWLALHERLHLFDRPRTIVLEARGMRAAFMGFPYTHEIRWRLPEILAAMNRDGLSGDVRVLCLHQCIKGATCGPSNFTFRFGPDVIRTGDMPRNVAVTLSGHIHRHQVLQPVGGPPIIYAGSTERTSFAEAPETKGFVVLELARSGLRAFEFRPLPARTMVTRTVFFGHADDMTVHKHLVGAGGRRSTQVGNPLRQTFARSTDFHACTPLHTPDYRRVAITPIDK